MVWIVLPTLTLVSVISICLSPRECISSPGFDNCIFPAIFVPSVTALASHTLMPFIKPSKCVSAQGKEFVCWDASLACGSGIDSLCVQHGLHRVAWNAEFLLFMGWKSASICSPCSRESIAAKLTKLASISLCLPVAIGQLDIRGDFGAVIPVNESKRMFARCPNKLSSSGFDDIVIVFFEVLTKQQISKGLRTFFFFFFFHRCRYLMNELLLNQKHLKVFQWDTLNCSQTTVSS